MLDKLERLKELALEKSNRFDIFHLKRFERDFVFTDKGVIGYEISESGQTSLRINYSGGIGFASAAGPFDETELIEFAIETSKFNQGSLPLLYDVPTTSVKIFDEQIEKIEYPELLAYSNETIDRIQGLALQYECRIKTVIDHIIFSDADGRAKSYKKSMLKVSFDAVGEEREHYNYRQASCGYFGFINEITETINRQKSALPLIHDLECKTVNVILSPFGLYCAMKNFIALKFNAKISVNEEEHPRDYFPGLSVYDSGIEDWKIGSQPFDDEGINCKVTPLMENGVINSYYYDLISADKFRLKSTGNGKRGWGIPPSPVPNNMIIIGDTRSENLIGTLNNGILIDYIVSDGRTDTINGIFCGNIMRGVLIKDGKMSHRISNLNVRIDFNKTLQQGAVFGNDDSWIGGEFCSPSLLLHDVDIIE